MTLAPRLDDIETDIAVLQGGGGGSEAGINYFLNGNFEADASNGVSVVNITSSAETTTPLFDDQSNKLTSSGSAGTADFSITGIDNAVLEGGIVCLVTGYLKTDAGVADGDWTVGVYNTTDASYATSQTDLKADTLNVHRTTFAPVTGKTYVLRVVSPASAAKVLVVDRLTMTPESNSGLVADFHGDWDDELVSGISMAIGNADENAEFHFRRDGADLLIQGGWSSLNAGGVSSTITPSIIGVTVDEAALQGTGTALNNLGGVLAYDDSTGNRYNGQVNLQSSDSFNLTGDFGAGSGQFNATNPFVWAASSNDRLSFNIRVPILEWRGQKVNLLTQEVVTANARGKWLLVSNAARSDGQAYDFGTEVYNTGLANSGNQVTVPSNGVYQVDAQVRADVSMPAGSNIVLRKNGTTTLGNSSLSDAGTNVGKIHKINTQVNLLAGDFLHIQQNNGTTSTIGITEGASYFCVTRLGDYGAFSPVGFGLATADTAGLVYKVADSVKITSGNLITTSATFSDITGTSITLVLPTASRVAYAFNCTGAINAATTSSFYYNVEIDGTTLLYGANGIQAEDSNLANHEVPICLSGLTEELAAGSHTFVVQHAVDGANTLNSFANSNTALTFAVWTI